MTPQVLALIRLTIFAIHERRACAWHPLMSGRMPKGYDYPYAR